MQKYLQVISSCRLNRKLYPASTKTRNPVNNVTKNHRKFRALSEIPLTRFVGRLDGNIEKPRRGGTNEGQIKVDNVNRRAVPPQFSSWRRHCLCPNPRLLFSIVQAGYFRHFNAQTHPLFSKQALKFRLWRFDTASAVSMGHRQVFYLVWLTPAIAYRYFYDNNEN